MKENKKEEVVVKRKFKFVKFLVVILILYIILFLGYKLFTAKIKNIFILNNNYLTDQEVIDESGLRNYPSFLLTTKYKIKKNLLKNSLIKEAKIKKKLWGIIYIEISEYEPLFIYQDKVILDNGTKIDNNDYILPILINDVNEEILTKFINKYKDIDKEIKMQISEIEYLPNDIDKERFLFTMNDGNYVYITIYKTLAINEYNKILPNLEGKKGILYLDSGNYFEILS
jgi:cell division septal protein FtsQ